MSRTYQPSFAGGVLSAGMYARTDVTKYNVGLRDARNVIVRQQGGLANRPGFRRAGAPLASKPRLIPFQFSSDEPYVLEFVGGRFRVLYNGAYILASGSSQEVERVTDGRFELNTTTPPATDTLHYLSGHSRFPGTLFRVGAVEAGDPVSWIEGEVAGRPLDQIADGGTPGLAMQPVYEQTHPYTTDELPQVNFAQDGNDLYLVHVNHPPHRLRRNDHDDWLSEPLTFTPGLPAPDMTVSTYNVTAMQEVDNGWLTVPGHDLVVGSAVVMRDDLDITPSNWRATMDAAYTVTEVNGNQVRLRRVDGKTFTGVGKNIDQAPGLRLMRPQVAVMWGDTYENPNPITQRYRIAAESEEGEEGPAGPAILTTFDLTVEGNTAVPVWKPVPGAARYVVYKEIAGTFGYVGTTSDLYLYDNNIAPDVSQGPQMPRNPFNTPGDYPGVIAFHEQRLFLAATKNDPQLVEASQSGRPLNFGVSRPPRESDAMTFRPRFREVNQVRALVSGPQLLLMTSGGEWLVSGGDEVALTPLNLFLRPLSYWGSDFVLPLLVGDVMMFVQRGGRIVRDFPVRAVGNEARPTDLTVMASDLFRRAPIVSWAYAQTPGSVIWTVLEDGGLRTLTYLAEHDVWGWTPHELGGGGLARQVVTVLESDEHAVYAVVLRGDRWVTERLDSRSDDPVEGLYLDAGWTARSEEPIDTVSGIWHLAGATVTVVVDGNVYAGLKVGNDGRVTLPEGSRGRVWHVGYPYEVFAQTLPIDLSAPSVGSTQGRLKRLSDVVVLTERTRGILAGRDRNSLDELKEWGAFSASADRLASEEVGVYKVNMQGDWLRAASVVVEHPYPLPFTLLGVAPEWEVGG